MPPAAELERCRAACVELLQARRERDEHECAERLLVRRMVHLWQQLKWERRQQGYAATRARLQVQLVEEDDEDLEADLEAEIAERRLLHALERSGAPDSSHFCEPGTREWPARSHSDTRPVALLVGLAPGSTSKTTSCSSNPKISKLASRRCSSKG